MKESAGPAYIPCLTFNMLSHRDIRHLTEPTENLKTREQYAAREETRVRSRAKQPIVNVDNFQSLKSRLRKLVGSLDYWDVSGDLCGGFKEISSACS